VVIPSGFAQASFDFVQVDAPFTQTCTLGVDVQGFAGDGPDACAALYLAWQNSFLAHQNASVRLSAVRIKYGPTATGPSFETTGESVGGQSGNPASSNVAYLIHKNTALGGRQGRGRLYIPGVTESFINAGGSVDSTMFPNLSGDCGDFFADLIAADLPPMLLHGDALAPTDILNFEPDPRCGTQRQRMRR